jgi:hypothetical protein
MPFMRRAKTVSTSGKEHSYVRWVENVRRKGKQEQIILVDLGAEERLPELVRALRAFLGPAEFLRVAGLGADSAAISPRAAQPPSTPAIAPAGPDAGGPAIASPGPDRGASERHNGDGVAVPLAETTELPDDDEGPQRQA